MKLKLRYRIILIFSIAFLAYWIYLSSLSFVIPDKENVNKRINYLERVINEPLDNNSEVVRLGTESTEFMLFSYAFSTYAFTNLIVQDSTYSERLIPLIKECINKTLTPIVNSSYGVDKNLLLLDSIPDYSVLYLGHLNLMLGCYRLVSGDNSFNELNDNISASLFRRYKDKSFLCLESYPNAIWIPDNTVALASLKLHSANSISNYDTMCSQWVEYAKNNFIEPKSKVLYSTIDSSTKKYKEEARGSMLGWSIMFIYQFDSVFAIGLYDNYKNHFSDNYGALRLFKEREERILYDGGDIDSGPIFLGYSIPANEFALGPAIVSEDYKTAKKIERLINWGTSMNEENSELKYKVRFVDLNISPMAEAIVLNSLTMTKWTE